MAWSVKADRGMFPSQPVFESSGSETPMNAAERLRTHGFAVVDAHLPEGLLEACKDCIETSPKGIRSLTERHKYKDRYQGDHLFLGFSDADMQREAALRDDVFAELIGCPQLLAGFTQVGIAAPKFWAGSVMSKPAGAPPLYWRESSARSCTSSHTMTMMTMGADSPCFSVFRQPDHDWAFWETEEGLSRHTEPAQVFAMVYLTDTTAANGCLRVCPGSHRRRLPLHDALSELQADGRGPAHGTWETQAPWEDEGAASPLFAGAGRQADPELQAADGGAMVDVPVKAGQLVLGDARVLHATHPNRSAARRSMLTLWYVNTGVHGPELEAYYAQKGKPTTANRPADDRCWELMRAVALDPASLRGVTPLVAPPGWQGGGPKSEAGGGGGDGAAVGGGDQAAAKL
eukprot:SAG22_NODE_757_length_7441_cov_29.224326_1_plen_403_part_00